MEKLNCLICRLMFDYVCSYFVVYVKFSISDEAYSASVVNTRQEISNPTEPGINGRTLDNIQNT